LPIYLSKDVYSTQTAFPHHVASITSVVLLLWTKLINTMTNQQDEQQDGIALDKRFKDQGQVPLFYVLGPEQQSSSTTTSSNNNEYNDAAPLRLYFSRPDLLRSWREQHPGGERLPPVRTLDLVSIFSNTMRGRADAYLPTTNLEFVPSAAALEAARELRSRGMVAPYSATKMIV
jgi:hypothetical protein